MSLGLVVHLVIFLMREGETDDSSIATADVELGWIRRDAVGGTYINVKVSWADTTVEVSWTGSSAVVFWA